MRQMKVYKILPRFVSISQLLLAFPFLLKSFHIFPDSSPRRVDVIALRGVNWFKIKAQKYFECSGQPFITSASPSSRRTCWIFVSEFHQLKCLCSWMPDYSNDRRANWVSEERQWQPFVCEFNLMIYCISPPKPQWCRNKNRLWEFKINTSHLVRHVMWLCRDVFIFLESLSLILYRQSTRHLVHLNNTTQSFFFLSSSLVLVRHVTVFKGDICHFLFSCFFSNRSVF